MECLKDTCLHDAMPAVLFSIKCGGLSLLRFASYSRRQFLWPNPPQLNRDPVTVKFVTSDIENFWRAYEFAGKETEKAKRVAIFQTEYLDKGSPGLKDFLRLRIKSAENLVSTINEHLKIYGRTHDAEIWRDFEADMYKPDFSKWVYNATTTKDRPADLGYYVGYLITRAYYRNAKDKRQAVYDILNIQDARAFYEASGVR
jgi:hypothetical protein